MTTRASFLFDPVVDEGGLMPVPIGTHAHAYEILEPIIRAIRPDDGLWQGRSVYVQHDDVAKPYWEAIKRGKSRVEQELQLEACLRHRRLTGARCLHG